MILAGCSGGNTRLHDDAARPDALVVATDARPDALADAPPDAPADAPPDAPPNAPPDAPVDAPADASPDAPADASAVARTDAPADAANDAMPDAPAEPNEIIIEFPPTSYAHGVTLVTVILDDTPWSQREISCTETCHIPIEPGHRFDFSANHVLGFPVTILPTTDGYEEPADHTFHVSWALDSSSIHQWSDTTACRRVAALNTGEMLCVNDTLSKRGVTGEILWSRNEPNITDLAVANDGSFLTSDGRKWATDGTVQWTAPVTAARQRQMAIGPNNDVAMIDNTASVLHIFDSTGQAVSTVTPAMGLKFVAVSAASNGDWVLIEEEDDDWITYWRFRRYSVGGVRLRDTFRKTEWPGFQFYEVFFAVVGDSAIWLFNEYYQEYWTAYQTATEQRQLIQRDAGGDLCHAFGVGRNPANQPVALINDCSWGGAGLRTTDNAIALTGSYHDPGIVEKYGVFPDVATLSPNGQYLAWSGEFVNRPPSPLYYLSNRNTAVTAVLKYPTQ